MAKKKDNTAEVTAPNGVVTTPVNTQEAEAKAQQEAEAKAQQEAEAKAQQEAEAKAQQEAEGSEVSGIYNHKGINYRFVEETPAKLSLDEGLFTQEEILSNHELIQSLIESNCIFITQA